MAGDYSRERFDPKLDFSAVFMQQGRVQLDADWNELIEILNRRLRAETVDIIGRCTVPKETPQGFQIGLSAGTLTIGPGRAYVHGLLAENHGKAPLEFDAVLAEKRGTAPLAYAEQPYFPNATIESPLPTGGAPHLVYLDVWQREVTYLEQPGLIENAVGVDTTARGQTVWQVRVLPNVGTGVTCSTPDDQIPGWLDKTQPSAGRLSSAAVGVAPTTDPCVIPPSGGYRGLENRLYRVEIHDDGAQQGPATFKWSRDNASVASNVTAISPLDVLTVTRVGRDSVLRFSPGECVEITDDWHEFAQKPGLIRQVKDVNDALLTVTLTQALPAGEFPVDGQGKTDPQRHTRLRRWDQKGEVRDSNGNLIIDLDAPNSPGVIPVPASGTSVLLEDGVQITFELEPANGRFRVGDYWTFAARTADASVEELDTAPPRGIHHHYCRLALVTFPSTVTDCRVLWPPEFGGEGCDCSVCVTAESHNSGALTIQFAIDKVKAVGGTVCLGPGIYNLGETPILIDGAQSIRLRGQGWRTILAHPAPGSALVVRRSLGVTIEDLTLLTAALGDDPSPALALQNCAGVTIQRCYLLRVGPAERGSAAIGLAGILVDTKLRDNVVFAPIGIGAFATKGADPTGLAPQNAPLLTALLLVENNALFCSQRGISLDGLSLHIFETRLGGNLLQDCAQGGIVARGWVAPGSAFNVEGNEARAGGAGIVVGVDRARIRANEVSPLQAGGGGAGILLAPGLDQTGVDLCQIIENRITGVGGDGIGIQAAVGSGMIKNNIIEGVGGGGIVMSEDGRADTLAIENNQLLNIAPQVNDPARAVVGIRVVQTQRATVAANTLVGIGITATQAPSRAGIQMLGTLSARIAGNEIQDLGPATQFLQSAAAVDCLSTFDYLDVASNTIRRNPVVPPTPTAPGGQWFGIRIRAPQLQSPVITLGNFLVAVAADQVFTFAGNNLAAQARRRECVNIHENSLDVYGEVPAVQVGAAGTLTFSNNQCRHLSQKQPVVNVEAGILILSVNRLRGSGDDDAVIARVPKDSFTVLGNITTGRILVGDPPSGLGGPWAPLNILAFGP
ncbi:MAG: DUF6519 domain-containing protein [Terriglobia bacterium]